MAFPLRSSPATVLSTPDSHSAASSSSRLPAPKIVFTPSQLASLNAHLITLPPPQILEWAIANLPGLYQTTAFGLTGTAALDMIAKISAAQGRPHLVDVIFIDTLYHFRETLDLAQSATSRVGAKLHTFTPQGVATVGEFESILGKRLWETDEDTYDFLIKVEPSRRAYDTLGVRAVITGRRRSQGCERASLPILEVDETGLVKVNPLAEWTYKDTWEYVQREEVPYNALIDLGYKSIGDWHSTRTPEGVKPVEGQAPVGDEDERSGRWGGTTKTECGLHKDYFKMKRAFEKKKREKEMAARDERREAENEPGRLP